ncbi:hypothetical protein EP7_001550 [Isosphaeraceae bacterium EP7]
MHFQAGLFRSLMVSAATAAVLASSPGARVHGQSDNSPANVRPVPKPGVDVPAADREALDAGLTQLGDALKELGGKKGLDDLIPDVEIYHKAVRDALKYNEFFAPGDIAKARALLAQGLERARALAKGETPWATQAGLVVRGYRSKIDGSVQPYGLVIPKSTSPTGPRQRLDVWFHGRGELLSEVNFIDDRQKSPGTFTPEDTIVLHPYGRYCNAFKFAGEVDVLESIDAVKRQYRIDEDRVSSRGFSMGGAAAWQLGVHYPDMWFATNPGAGFSETPRFLKVFQNETLTPTPYEKTLWRMFDCNDWAINLIGLPVVAYSGDQDSQKQAADVMEEALLSLGVRMTHIIGPNTKHSYEPKARLEVDRRMASLAAHGRDRTPEVVNFVTYTLRYNKSHWVVVNGLTEHWNRGLVNARLTGPSQVLANTKNLTALSFDMAAGECPFPTDAPVVVTIDGQSFQVPGPMSDRSWNVAFAKDGCQWVVGTIDASKPRKVHGLQGPIDDAFMDSFVFVRPTGTPDNAKVGEWASKEMERATKRWRTQFRGEARVVDDSAISDSDIAGSNLILWGDRASNAVLRKIADKLPIVWTAATIKAGSQEFPAADHALILIAPNPLNPSKYVVLNSGFTFREYDDLNNARQVPKLPDWAIVDVKTPPDNLTPGKVVAADFFDESWLIRPR